MSDIFLRIMLQQYDASALQNYRLCALTVDMVYPIYYAFLLSLLLVFLLKQRDNAKQSIHAVRMIPFLMMIIDWAENLTLISIVEQWPVLNHTLANTAGVLTLTKWLLLLVIILLLLFIAVTNKRQRNHLIHG